MPALALMSGGAEAKMAQTAVKYQTTPNDGHQGATAATNSSPPTPARWSTATFPRPAGAPSGSRRRADEAAAKSIRRRHGSDEAGKGLASQATGFSESQAERSHLWRASAARTGGPIGKARTFPAAPNHAGLENFPAGRRRELSIRFRSTRRELRRVLPAKSLPCTVKWAKNLSVLPGLYPAFRRICRSGRAILKLSPVCS